MFKKADKCSRTAYAGLSTISLRSRMYWLLTSMVKCLCHQRCILLHGYTGGRRVFEGIKFRHCKLYIIQQLVGHVPAEALLDRKSVV